MVKNAATARAGKSVVRPSTAEKNAHKPPISAGLVFLLLFVLVGGGMCDLTPVPFCSVWLPHCGNRSNSSCSLLIFASRIRADPILYP